MEVASTQPSRVDSLAHALVEAEAELFVGRAEEQRCFQEIITGVAARPGCVWVSGPAGIGKSALVRTFTRLAQQRQFSVLRLDGVGVPAMAGEVLQHLASQLGMEASPPLTPERVTAALNAEAASAPVLLAIDAYEHLEPLDEWFRTEVLRRLHPGTVTVFSGRHSMNEVWALEPAWRMVGREIAVGPLADEPACAMLEQLGVDNAPARSQLCSLAEGSPQLLGLCATAWVRLHGKRRAEGPHDTAAAHALREAVLEQFLHPHSRRLGWRAGAEASGVDRLVAVAAIVRTFDRDLLLSVLGEPDAFRGLWPRLVDLPVVEAVDGRRYRVKPGVQRQLADVVRHQRPWQERAWRANALRYHLGRLREGRIQPGQAWLEIAHVSRDAPWFAALHPEDDVATPAWEVVATPAPAEVLAGIGEDAAGVAVRILAEQTPRAVMVVRQPGTAGPLACGVAVDMPRLEDPLPQRIPNLSQVRAAPVGGRFLVIAVCGAHPAARRALFRELAGKFTDQTMLVVITPDGDVADVLGRLGGERLTGGAPDAVVHLLDVDALRRAGWPCASESSGDVAVGGDLAELAREALSVLHDHQRLRRTALGQYLSSLPSSATSSTPHAWILDALASADLSVGGIDGRSLLRHYYVDRVRPHEALAERLALPRTTYFRAHREALARLAAHLYGQEP